MKSILRTLLLLALLSALVISHVRAQEAAEADPIEDDAVGEEEEVDFADYAQAGYEDLNDMAGDRAPFVTRAIFPNSTSPVLAPHFPAGAPARSLIAYQNKELSAQHQVILVAGYLQPPSTFDTVLQNFSVVRQARAVRPSETATFEYTFRPDGNLEPGVYNLVIGVYYADAVTNATAFAPAFNGTVYVDEPLGTDPRTILTYLTLLAIFGAIAYYVADRFGVVKMIAQSRREASKPSNKPALVEVGSKRGAGYDPEYVGKEHLRYREDLLRKSSASPSNRHASASPNKKRKGGI